MEINVTVTEKDIKRLVVDFLSTKTNMEIKEEDVEFLVMSKQNYKVTEWEKGNFKATINKRI